MDYLPAEMEILKLKPMSTMLSSWCGGDAGNEQCPENIGICNDLDDGGDVDPW